MKLSRIFLLSTLLLLTFLALDSQAIPGPIPKQFQGNWGIKGQKNYASGLQIEVRPFRITLYNGTDSRQFGEVDICHSCEGGAQYKGIVKWVYVNFKEPNYAADSPFILYFNAGERAGILKIDFEDKELAKRFPFGNSQLEKCKSTKSNK